MKKGIKFFVALFLFRIKMIFSSSDSISNMDSSLKIDPDFVKKLDKPKNFIVVLGSIDPSRVGEILANAFKVEVKSYICAKSIDELSYLILKESSFTGKNEIEYAILSINLDRRHEIFNTFDPDILVLTEIMDDSLMSSISDIHLDIHKIIKPSTKLVINADDPNQETFINENSFLYGIDMLDGEKLIDFDKNNNIYNEDFEAYEYKFRRYAQIGRIYNNNDISYAMERVDNQSIVVSEHGIKQNYKLVVENNTLSYYKEMAYIVTMRALGFEREYISNITDFIEPKNLIDFSRNNVVIYPHNRNEHFITHILNLASNKSHNVEVVIEVDHIDTFFLYKAKYTNENIERYYNVGNFAYEAMLAQRLQAIENISIFSNMEEFKDVYDSNKYYLILTDHTENLKFVDGGEKNEN